MKITGPHFCYSLPRHTYTSTHPSDKRHILPDDIPLPHAKIRPQLLKGARHQHARRRGSFLRSIQDSGRPLHVCVSSPSLCNRVSYAKRTYTRGAIEPQFYAELLRGLGIDASSLPDQHNDEQWPAMKERFAQIFATKTQAQWTEIFDGTDACVAPVLSFQEAIPDASAVTTPEKQWPRQAAPPQPAPILSRTPAREPAQDIDDPFLQPGEHSADVLAQFGIPKENIHRLVQSGAVIDAHLSSSKL